LKSLLSSRVAIVTGHDSSLKTLSPFYGGECHNGDACRLIRDPLIPESQTPTFPITAILPSESFRDRSLLSWCPHFPTKNYPYFTCCSGLHTTGGPFPNGSRHCLASSLIESEPDPHRISPTSPTHALTIKRGRGAK